MHPFSRLRAALQFALLAVVHLLITRTLGSDAAECVVSLGRSFLNPRKV